MASLVYDGSQENYAALSLVLLGGAVESVAAVVSKNAPKKDWAPALFDGRGAASFSFFRSLLTHASTQATTWSTSSLIPPQL